MQTPNAQCLTPNAQRSARCRRHVRRAANAPGAAAPRNRFTLIELLVVIAIIAILAAMLLPTLRAAKEKGQCILCVGNHRQVAVATIAYTDDFDGVIPYQIMDARPGPNPPTWASDRYNSAAVQLLRNNYLTARKTYVAAVPFNGHTGTGGNMWLAGVLRCPTQPLCMSQVPNLTWDPYSAQQPILFKDGVFSAWTSLSSADGIYGGGAWYPSGGIYCDYGFNAASADQTVAVPFNTKMWGQVAFPAYLPNGLGNGLYIGLQPPALIHRAAKPSALWLSADAGNQRYGIGVSSSMAIFRHPGYCANFSYFDGHVETLHSSDCYWSNDPRIALDNQRHP